MANIGRRLSYTMVIALVLGVLLVALNVFRQGRHEMELSYRVQFAVNEVYSMQGHLREFYLDARRWPGVDDESGVGTKVHYPDGGYYELEDQGVIRIRFTVIPELLQGSIVLTPVVRKAEVVWRCRADGGFPSEFLPAECR